jgi:hypothetical protein
LPAPVVCVRASQSRGVRLGVTGSVKFDGNGDNMQQIISAYEVKNGAWVQVPFTP